MSDFSNAVESSIVKQITGETAWTAPAGTFVQLHSAAPGEDGLTAVIASVGGRKSAAWAAEAAGAASTNADLEWTNGTGGSITVTHVSIFDSITAGIALYVGALTASKTVPDTEIFRIPSGSLTISAA